MNQKNQLFQEQVEQYLQLESQLPAYLRQSREQIETMLLEADSLSDQLAKQFTRFIHQRFILVPRVPFFTFMDWYPDDCSFENRKVGLLSNYYWFSYKYRPLAKTSTVALPMPEHDGQSNTNYRFPLQCVKPCEATIIFEYVQGRALI